MKGPFVVKILNVYQARVSEILVVTERIVHQILLHQKVNAKEYLVPRGVNVFPTQMALKHV